MAEALEGGVLSNLARLRAKLGDGSLAKRLADAYDTAKTNEVNRNALKQAVEDELDRARRAIEQDKNQVD